MADRNEIKGAYGVGIDGDTKEITINGRALSIYHPSLDDITQTNANSFASRISDDKKEVTTVYTRGMSYVRFGNHVYYAGKRNDPYADNRHYVFAIGNLTPADQVPAAGKAQYHGKSTYFVDKGNTIFGRVEERNGDAYFNVDFGNKTIVGEASSGWIGVHQVPLKA